jgi:predicted DNA-binding transcriptional regulator AlpA
MIEVMTVQEVAAMLKMSKRQIYELCRERVRENMPHPLPRIVVNSNLRFVRHEVESWIEKLGQQENTQ